MRRGLGWSTLAVLVSIIAIWTIAFWTFAAERRDEFAPRPPLAVFTTLPLFWADVLDIAAMLSSKNEQHWARVSLEQAYTLKTLDVLHGLDRERNLLMAQPRPLSPAENVALDAWVRNGGRVLLFADPALTQDSRFAPGDKRRPQDTVLLSPILGRWGLSLEFVEDQPLGERVVGLGEAQVPVNLPGRLVSLGGGSCDITASGLMARCKVGKGRATVVADAAILERQEGADAIEPRRVALIALARDAFE